MKQEVVESILPTPLGGVAVRFTPRGLAHLGFATEADSGRTGGQGEREKELARQLAEYFAGERRRFDVPLDLAGTPFQRAVWRVLLEIPFGETLSYAALAEQLGRPRAVRAVGAANGRNPVSILVPCHRVIGADGALRGYAWGLERKRALLDLERSAVRSDEKRARLDAARALH